MKNTILILSVLSVFILCSGIKEPTIKHNITENKKQTIMKIANKNKIKPDQKTVNAIVRASQKYNINVKYLTAIAIIETQLGNNIKTKKNKNGTKDIGLFQINSVNYSKCSEYNLNTHEGSALCAAKLLNKIKKKHGIDSIGLYHSHNLKRKERYEAKINNILKDTVIF